MSTYTSGTPLWGGKRMARGCTRKQLLAAGRELKAMGFNVAQNKSFSPFSPGVHSHWTKGGWHSADNGYGAIDINGPASCNNTWMETCLLDEVALPVLNKHGIRGVMHKPVGRNDHKTWMHADEGTYRNVTKRRWPASQIAQAKRHLKKQPASTSAAPGKLRVDGYWGKQTKMRWQQVLGTKVDGVISKPYSQMVAKIQQGLGLKVTGRWDRHLTLALQKRYGTTQDGKTSKPSQWVRKLQERLNRGTW